MKKGLETDIFPRFSETDAGGYISNTSYFIYMEEARSKFFQAIGFAGAENRRNIDFIIASAACDFIAQASAGQTLKITTMVDKIGTKSFALTHRVNDKETGSLIAAGQAAIVCFDFQKQRSEPIPIALRGLLEGILVPA